MVTKCIKCNDTKHCEHFSNYVTDDQWWQCEECVKKEKDPETLAWVLLIFLVLTILIGTVLFLYLGVAE